MSGPATRCGFIAIIGAPNAGKSTLVNRLVGAKVTIVSPKVQTTRMRVRGVAIADAAQLIFVDTPGIFAPRRRLDRAMVSAAWEGAGDADILALLVDAPAYLRRTRGGADARSADDTDAIIERLAASGAKAMLVLNKIDAMSPPQLLTLAADLFPRADFTQTFMISAETGDGVHDFRDACARQVPAGPWLYPEDQLADLPQRLLAAELVREKLTLKLHQELPYAATVETEDWEERGDGSAKISVTIFVQRDSQKAIVVGKGGRMVKEIGEAARKELSDMLGRPIHLFLFVKVRENWAEDPERYSAIGLDYPKGN